MSASEAAPISPAGTPALAVHALSRAALPLARRLAAMLGRNPWAPPLGRPALARIRLFVPERFCPDDAEPFSSLSDLLAREYRAHAAHAFIGAAGIAVRALAPQLSHKSVDPPVLVLDPAGRHVISLLSGHWGGGNALARHVASLLDAEAVITTASDASCGGGAAPALDLLLRDAGLRPVDWDYLPQAQALVLESEPPDTSPPGLAPTHAALATGRSLPLSHAPLDLWDPLGLLPAHPALRRIPAGPGDIRPPAAERPLLAVHWRRLPTAPDRLRVAAPLLHLGVGCHSGVSRELTEDAVRSLLIRWDLEPLALAAVATVTARKDEPALRALADRLVVPLRHFDERRLAACRTPSPSEAAGRHFGLPAFSVCEAAALLSAGEGATLLVPKVAVAGTLTLALAVARGKRA